MLNYNSLASSTKIAFGWHPWFDTDGTRNTTWYNTVWPIWLYDIRKWMVVKRNWNYDRKSVVIWFWFVYLDITDQINLNQPFVDKNQLIGTYSHANNIWASAIYAVSITLNYHCWWSLLSSVPLWWIAFPTEHYDHKTECLCLYTKPATTTPCCRL